MLDAINAATGWLHTGDPALLLHTDKLFASLREKLADGWFNDLLRELLPRSGAGDAGAHPAQEGGRGCCPCPHRRQAGAGPSADRGRPWRRCPQRAGQREQLAGAELLHHPSAGSLYLNFYYDLGECTPEEMPYLDLLTDVLDELDTPEHTAQQLNTLRSTWLGDSRPSWTSGPGGRRVPLPRKAEPVPEPAGTQSGKGCGAGRRVAV